VVAYKPEHKDMFMVRILKQVAEEFRKRGSTATKGMTTTLDKMWGKK
jgi:hypothetical protein